VAGAQKEMSEKPQSIKMARLRELGGLKLFERQSVSGAATRPEADGRDLPPGHSPLFNWTITVFVPSGATFESYELDFIGLTMQEYETDQEFLRQIIDSVQYTPAATQP
jgi:hypothetical protein